MKTFTLVPPQHIAERGIIPIATVDDQEACDKSPFLDHYSAYIYDDNDEVTIDALAIGESMTDSTGWVWTRHFNSPATYQR